MTTPPTPSLIEARKVVFAWHESLSEAEKTALCGQHLTELIEAVASLSTPVIVAAGIRDTGGGG